jgi:hypothetical protein
MGMPEDICDILDTGVANYATQARAAAELRQTRKERDEARAAEAHLLECQEGFALALERYQTDLAAAVALLEAWDAAMRANRGLFPVWDKTRAFLDARKGTP